MKKLVVGLIALAVSACEILPNTGPSRNNIFDYSAENGGAYRVVNVSSRVANVARPANNYGFPGAFFSAAPANYESITPGDIIQVTVWENVDTGLFATLGNRVTPLEPMRVSEAGTIFMPYVGVVKATGRTEEQLRREITNRLASQTPDPQVEVRTTQSGVKGGVMVFSSGGGGLVPFNEGNLRLSSMMASAGIGVENPESTRITVTRGSQSGTILAQQLYDNPKFDIALRDNDRIVLETDRRYYRILGASGGQNLVPFQRAEVSVLDALSETGGLNSAVSDPSGIFVFRTASSYEAQNVLGQYYTGSNHIVYVINLRDPNGVFLAKQFFLRTGDTIYVTEAPYVTWTKVISSITSGLGSATSLATAVNAN